MNVKCFACDALMEAADSNALANAFVAHGKEAHTWSYPEEAIRNYATNYAEATERLTGSTERLSEIADVTVHPVTEDASTTGSGSSTTTRSPTTPIGPHAIVSNRTYRRHRNNLSAHGATRAQPWLCDFGAARPSGISRTSTANLQGGSTLHFVPTTASIDLSIRVDPSRDP